ncbi:DNA polymerase subunit gamma-2, mitochondrial-like [Ptychodera flava]|uniref:DNA polymerase subunit gamma-2, mitochondrial-like n=1 Tax=Ptychodera flava TaxID=63121 RepID=UPI003969F097
MTSLQKLISLCSRYGYVYSAAEVPGKVLPGSYLYGPLGTELKRNLLQQWWTSTVLSQELVYGVDSTQLMYDYDNDGQALSVLNPYSEDSTNESDGGSLIGDHIFLQPSCRKGILCQYPAGLKLLNYKLPFGLAQIGHCFRRNFDNMESTKFLFNLPEFTQMSLQFYSPPKTATKWMDVWQRERILWWRKFAAHPSKFKLTDIKTSETQQTVEVQYEFPWGVDTIERITNRGDVDILEVQQMGINVQGKFGRRNVTPVIIEATAGLDRGILAYLLDAYQEKERTDTRGKLRPSELLCFHAKITPFKVAVIPLKNTRDMREISEHLSKELRMAGVNTLYMCDTQTTLDQHFVRFDAMGVPFTVIINENTLKNGVIAMRNRDTTLREKLHITEVTPLLLKHLSTE